MRTRLRCRTGPCTCAAGNGRWPGAPGNATPRSVSGSTPGSRRPRSAAPPAWTAGPCRSTPGPPALMSWWPHEPGIEAGRVQAVHLPAVEPGPHRRLPLRRPTVAARLAGPAARRPSAGTSTCSGRPARPSRPPRPAPKTREITRCLLSRPGSLDDGDQARLAAVRAGSWHLDALARHIRDFAGMMTRRQGLLALEDWLTRVEADDQPELHSLAACICATRRPSPLSCPALRLRRHGGKRLENKIKMIKRQMYGRASFALLRKRVILHPA